MNVARAVALVAAACTFASLTYVLASRLFYPFDLEWLEGATLWHAQRLLDGQPLYPPPSLDFVPLPYSPLYPALLALVGRAFGLSYLAGRALSIAAFAGALAIGWRFIRAAGGSRALATAAMAIPCAAFVPTGAWIDLVRVDSLWLLLAASGATLAFRARRSAVGLAAAALLLVAAFFAKQTAAPLMLAVALGLAALDRRAALRFVAALALFGLPALWAMQRATDGWFWFYVYRVHHSHDFAAGAALRVPGRVALLVLPALPLAVWALAIDRSPALRWAAWLAASGIGISALAKATAGAYLNAYLPGVYFASLLAGVAAARLLAAAEAEADPDADADGQPSRWPTAVWALVAAAILLAPGVLPRALQRLRPSLYRWPQTTGYALSPLIPTATDRDRNESLITRLRAVDGEVWLPSRPWYARLAGKRPLAGEMALSDLHPTGVAIAGLDEALHTRRFAAVVLDQPSDPLLRPLLDRADAIRLDAATDVAGIRAPAWWLTPRVEP